MTIKEYTESIISKYIDNGGSVHPDITLDIFKFIESNETLLADHKELLVHYPGLNPTMGKYICQHFDLRVDQKVIVLDQCSLIKTYTRFHKK